VLCIQSRWVRVDQQQQLQGQQKATETHMHLTNMQSTMTVRLEHSRIRQEPCAGYFQPFHSMIMLCWYVTRCTPNMGGGL
jgi:hypothetical protein